jgi:hypothetical protein
VQEDSTADAVWLELGKQQLVAALLSITPVLFGGETAT